MTAAALRSAFDGKVCWLTGASLGIGREMALQLAAAGARLVLSARNVEALEELREQCGEAQVELVPFDFGDESELEPAVEHVLAAFGRVDHFINSAGITQRSLALDTPHEIDRLLMQVNALTPIRLSKLLLPHMIQSGGGHLTLLSSIVGKFGVQRRSTYSASKHALHGSYEALRLELAEDGIGVTLACPGPIATGIGSRAPDGGKEVEPQDTMSTAECARRILVAAAGGKREVHVGGFEMIGITLKRWAPWLLERILLRRARS